ncbi:MAG TPA: hypothetical protein VN238_22750 [Solirubrobacteraceae bacterium]|nr:hypothetical protein [Solirubrobacteraceae bacterium]
MDASTLLALTTALASGEPVFVPWRREVADALPALHTTVAAFDPGPRDAGHASARWLRDHALDAPPTSATRLLVRDGVLLGFYALANGQAELSSSHQKRLGSRRPTQPAVVLTQIARHADAPPGTGRDLVNAALSTARRVTEYSAATVLALDPYDEATAEMWRARYGFRTSRTGAAGGLKRLWTPLHRS